jgi:hypothetical protein
MSCVGSSAAPAEAASLPPLAPGVGPHPAQVAGHRLEEGRAPALATDDGCFLKPLPCDARGDCELAFYRAREAAARRSMARRARRAQACPARRAWLLRLRLARRAALRPRQAHLLHSRRSCPPFWAWRTRAARREGRTCACATPARRCSCRASPTSRHVRPRCYTPTAASTLARRLTPRCAFAAGLLHRRRPLRRRLCRQVRRQGRANHVRGAWLSRRGRAALGAAGRAARSLAPRAPGARRVRCAGRRRRTRRSRALHIMRRR